jgi:hypothetical protein
VNGKAATAKSIEQLEKNLFAKARAAVQMLEP